MASKLVTGRDQERIVADVVKRARGTLGGDDLERVMDAARNARGQLGARAGAAANRGAHALDADAGKVDNPLFPFIQAAILEGQGEQAVTHEVAGRLRQTGQNPALAGRVVNAAKADYDRKLSANLSAMPAGMDQQSALQAATLATMEGVAVAWQHAMGRIAQNEQRLRGIQGHMRRSAVRHPPRSRATPGASTDRCRGSSERRGYLHQGLTYPCDFSALPKPIRRRTDNRGPPCPGASPCGCSESHFRPPSTSSRSFALAAEGVSGKSLTICL